MVEFFVALVIMVIALLVGVPVALAIAGTTLYYFTATGVPLGAIAQKTMLAVEQGHTLLAIPFFVLAGQLMNECGLTDRIYLFTRALVGHFRGGLGHVDVVSSMVFSGMSGSATADVVGIGQVVLRAETAAGFPKNFAVGLTGATAVIGPIIPPSIALVIIGVITDQSIKDLFLAGVVPGVVIGLLLSIVVFAVANRRGFPRDSWQGIGHLLRTGLQALPALVMPIIILGAIGLGVTSVTEAGAIAVAYALLVGTLIYRQISWRNFYDCMRTSVFISANIMFLIGIATAFAYAVVIAGVPARITTWALDLSPNKIVVVLAINIVLLLMGMFIEPTAAMLLVTPIMLPVATAAGMDPIQFCLIVVVNLMMGLVTPPFGILLFALSDISGESASWVAWSVRPFLLPLLAALLLISYVPAASLWLPGLFR